ncbi:alpha-N-arabinofuranosidase [Opitutaceae bacterium TAV5]|nr:alpha-N-arabinofuranosidase [Opitutaceae bacterium TAV5]
MQSPLAPPLRPSAWQASVAVDVRETFGVIEPEIYGQYFEHVQESEQCIYPAVWDDRSPLSDERGLRKDVVAAAREMAVPVVRWPGGCFADVYHWENGIGPREKRPVLPNRHWGGTESHRFGTDEFLAWSRQAGSKPYLNVNLGSGTLDEALRWLEYCNGDKDTEQGRRRAANGHAEPYAVRYWGIGNETWAPWETGQMDAATYARTLAEWAAAMKRQDPSIRILAVGSSAGNDPEWDRKVLASAGELIDCLTLHIYASSTQDVADEYDAVVFTPGYFDFQIRKMLRAIDEARAEGVLKKEVRISIDEWNIRHFATGKGEFHDSLRRRDPRNVEDAMFVAGALNVMLRHCPRVAMANYVFLVNGHAPLLVNRDRVVRTPLFHVFRQYTKWMRGTSLRTITQCPVVKTPPPRMGGMSDTAYPEGYDRQEASLLDSAAALHDDGTIVLSLVNRHRSDPAEVALRLPAGYRVKRSWTLGHEDPKAANDFENPDRVVPIEKDAGETVSSWICAPKTVVLLSCGKDN